MKYTTVTPNIHLPKEKDFFKACVLKRKIFPNFLNNSTMLVTPKINDTIRYIKTTILKENSYFKAFNNNKEQRMENA